ncbi:reverse transcriptase domain-containing protein [Tanacetum coccineum]
MDVLDYATYLKKILRERPKMGYQIKASTNENNLVVLEDPLPPKEKDPRSFTLPCYINNIYFEKALEYLVASISVMPLTTFTNLSLGELAPMELTVELADRTIKHPKGIENNILVGIGKFVFLVDFIILHMPEDVKVPLILERPFLSTTHAKIDVFKREITLRMFTVMRRWEMSLLENHFDPKGIAENILVGIGKFVFPVNFIILDMPEDVKVPLILGRPFLSTTHAKIDVFKRKITLRVGDDKITFKSIKPASILIKRVYVLGLRVRMDLDLEARLMGEALILNRSLDPEFEDFIKLNDLNEPLELKRNQVNDLGPTREEGEIIDEPIKNIVKTRNDNEKIEGINEYPSIYDYDRKIHVECAYNWQFSCMIGFTNLRRTWMFTMMRRWEMSLLENHFAELHVSKQGDSKDLLPFTMVRPLLKVSAHDKLNGISHPHQLLKSFYKGILNLGPKYVRDEKMEEWLTRGHVSMHKME